MTNQKGCVILLAVKKRRMNYEGYIIKKRQRLHADR